MGLWKKTTSLLGHVVDFRVDRWVDLSYLKKSSAYYVEESKRLFTAQQPQQEEEFEEAVLRLALSPEDLSQQSKRYAYMAVLFIAIGALIFSYALLLVFLKNWMGSIICFALTLYALTLAFRSHFWHFQMSQKKLGCSVSEWFKSLIKGKRDYR